VMVKNIRSWELAGFVFVSITGTLLHFVFEWSGSSQLAAAVSPVNESVWEHLKMTYFPLIVFSAVEYIFIRSSTENFFRAKAASVYIMPAAVMLIHYSFKAVFGKSLLPADIASFYIAAGAGYYVSYRILLSSGKSASSFFHFIYPAAILIPALVFIIFTFYPPRLPVFTIRFTAGSGLLKKLIQCIANYSYDIMSRKVKKAKYLIY
jgi:hypothetical protein